MSGTPEHQQLWQQGEDFNPQPISGILGVNEIAFRSPLYGDAYRWPLNSGRNPAMRLEFFYKSCLLRVGTTSGAGDYQSRLYLVESVATDLDSNHTLSFFCAQPGINTRVTVYPQGGVDESHRFGQTPIIDTPGFSVPVREIGRSGTAYNPRDLKPAVTVEQTAALLDCTEAYVRQLARTGRLVGEKLGRDWFLDPDSVARFPKPRSHRQSSLRPLAEEKY